MKLMIIPFIFSFASPPEFRINFGQDQAGQNWYVVNDGVMGGMSKSQLTITENSAILKGKVSLENNGGFASFRSPFQVFDLSKYKSVEIKYRSSGHDIALVFALYKKWFEPKYKINLHETSGEWKTVNVDLSSAKEYRIARITGAYLKQDQLSQIIRLGFITNSKIEGEFQFELDYLLFK